MTNENQSDEKALVPAEGQNPVPSEIPLMGANTLDLSFLPEAERQALLQQYASGLLDLGLKAQELRIDAGALRETLRTLAENTQEVAASGNAVTFTQTLETSMGRTEVIMGNTRQAESGKLTRSQSGATDWTPLFVVAAIVLVIVVVLVLAAR